MLRLEKNEFDKTHYDRDNAYFEGGLWGGHHHAIGLGHITEYRKECYLLILEVINGGICVNDKQYSFVKWFRRYNSAKKHFNKISKYMKKLSAKHRESRVYHYSSEDIYTIDDLFFSGYTYPCLKAHSVGFCKLENTCQRDKNCPYTREASENRGNDAT